MIMSNSAIEFNSICLVSLKSWIWSDILYYSFSFLYSLKHLTRLSIFTKAYTFLIHFSQETFSLLDKYSLISLFFWCDLVDLCALSRRYSIILFLNNFIRTDFIYAFIVVFCNKKWFKQKNRNLFFSSPCFSLTISYIFIVHVFVCSWSKFSLRNHYLLEQVKRSQHKSIQSPSL